MIMAGLVALLMVFLPYNVFRDEILTPWISFIVFTFGFIGAIRVWNNIHKGILTRRWGVTYWAGISYGSAALRGGYVEGAVYFISITIILLVYFGVLYYEEKCEAEIRNKFVPIAPSFN